MIAASNVKLEHFSDADLNEVAKVATFMPPLEDGQSCSVHASRRQQDLSSSVAGSNSSSWAISR